jgi:hypothetical protein
VNKKKNLLSFPLIFPLLVFYDSLTNKENLLKKEFLKIMKKSSITEKKRYDFDKIFKGEKSVNRDEFILNCFKNQTLLQFFDRIEQQLSKYTDHIERKYKIAFHKYPLDKIAKFYKSEVPCTISIF